MDKENPETEYIERRERELQNTSARQEVKETERKMWQERMQGKPAVDRDLLFDNSRGSSLLFEARTGVLRTKTFRAKFEEVDLLCTACKTEI